MSTRHSSRVQDIVDALDAIDAHLARGDLGDALVYDAVRIRLFEIAEAVKGIDPDLLATEPAIPWKEITRMRDHLAHHYFDADRAIVQDVVDHYLAPLRSAVQRLIESMDAGASS